MAQPYQHKELHEAQEIRLLVLVPGKDSDEICCKLEHAILSDNPEFEALSYAWGDPSITRTILCEGGTLQVTENLFQALRHLRHEDRERCLWADAICIDQCDDLEKNHQLPLMGRIYSGAWRTVIWIGVDENNNAGLAFDYIYRVFRAFASSGYNELRIRHFIAVQEGLQKEELKAWIWGLFDALAPMFEKSWFNRLWVVQEFVLSKQARMAFGKKTIPMERVSNAAIAIVYLDEALANIHRLKSTVIHNLANMLLVRWHVQKRRNDRANLRQPLMLELFRCTTVFKFTDPRDRIYAILGLAADSNFQADYTLSVRDTFIKFAEWALTAAPDLAALSYGGGVDESSWNIPSWAPFPSGVRGFINHVRKEGDYSASGKDQSRVDGIDIWSRGSANELLLRGNIIDLVAEHLGPPSYAHGWDHPYYHMLNNARVAGITPLEANLANERYQRFCAVMTWELRPVSQYMDFHNYFLALASGIDPSEGEGGMERMETIRGNFTQRYLDIFCRTSNDRFAWVPGKTKPGDRVCILLGASIPYIIRPTPGGKFQLVGECWVQGLMEGEALDQPEFQWREICLI